MLELENENSLEFLLMETDLSGNVSVVKDKKTVGVIPSFLPNGLPLTLSSFKEEIEERVLSSPEWLYLNNRKDDAPFFPKEFNLSEIYSADLCSLQSSLQVTRNPTSGELLGFYEEKSDGVNLTPKNSCSLLRTPGLPNEALRGTSTNYLFWPGGMESIDEMLKDKTSNVIDFEGSLKTCPPGFEAGIDFEKADSSAVFNVDNIFSDFDDDKLNESVPCEIVQTDSPKDETDHEIMDLLPEQSELVVAKEKLKIKTILEGMWAEKVDISKRINDFHQRLPNMAHKFPFELDTFQKQAVLKLEDHQSVFIAAHTSAGKTVVAEYAIALSAKNMTRVIYTSPIKALSNQKFCDFKQTFKDVGLITGDVQINPDAFCLIMTTEILRSMLYNGSDVIRDLEWVIFDEVHYINDIERGVVWEEVLIMLPDHCNIILLSATVPNTMEFANWVGRIKKKKIYVISTLKRPVPLEHHLYTGNSSKTNKELFLLVDADRKFLSLGYKKAVAAKNERQTKHGKSFGAKLQHGGNPVADKGIWLSLINRLQKEDQLPIVAFTFSRRRCNENASALESLDLTTATEKSEIHVFFNKCIQKLKGTDNRLPQVIQISQLLLKGLGIHHSGILPILKEVVEMLFARGLVKLLFATETFAMGVNMPARTVVFDSLRKHDGTRMRNLLPGEYIQMAGRAGRRGLDSIGTVILLCKGDVPEMSELHLMMLGKPTKLESQFRLTYGMILNLLRVEQLRVEEVLKHSFSEFNARKDSKAQEQKLKQLHTEMEAQLEVQELIANSDYQQYLEVCQELLSLRAEVQEVSLLGNSGRKVMQPGRVVVLDCEKYKQCVALILKVNTSKAQCTFTVLVLCDEVEVISDKSIWDPSLILGKKLFYPESKAKHDVIEVEPKGISYVTTKTLRINADHIVADFKKRQQPRFSNDPPLQCTSVATQELMRLVESNQDGMTPIDLFTVLGLNEIEIVEMFTRIKSLEELIRNAFTCPTLPRFKSQIQQVEAYLILKKEYDNLKYLLSEASLHLLPEYEQRVQVLKHMKYIDGCGAVQLKGRVACEISSHEIVLTELVFENVFSAMDPSEIVALLSCAVFQQRVDLEEVNFTAKLKEGMQKIIEIATGVGQTQYDYGIRMPVDDFVSTLKFGLVEVVYEWTKGTSFKDITGLTSVQEGVIVRTIQRLNETCRDVRNAAKVIGDPTLHAKMEKCSDLIKRDIVFAASLYIQ